MNIIKSTRRKFTNKFKLKVVLEALKERETLLEITKRFELHPNQNSNIPKAFFSLFHLDFKSEFQHKNHLIYQDLKLTKNGKNLHFQE